MHAMSEEAPPPQLVKRADRIGEFWGYPESRAFAELTDRLPRRTRTLRSVLVGMVREAD